MNRAVLLTMVGAPLLVWGQSSPASTSQTMAACERSVQDLCMKMAPVCAWEGGTCAFKMDPGRYTREMITGSCEGVAGDQYKCGDTIGFCKVEGSSCVPDWDLIDPSMIEEPASASSTGSGSSSSGSSSDDGSGSQQYPTPPAPPAVCDPTSQTTCMAQNPPDFSSCSTSPTAFSTLAKCGCRMPIVACAASSGCSCTDAMMDGCPVEWCTTAVPLAKPLIFKAKYLMTSLASSSDASFKNVLRNHITTFIKGDWIEVVLEEKENKCFGVTDENVCMDLYISPAMDGCSWSTRDGCQPMTREESCRSFTILGESQCSGETSGVCTWISGSCTATYLTKTRAAKILGMQPVADVVVTIPQGVAFPPAAVTSLVSQLTEVTEQTTFTGNTGATGDMIDLSIENNPNSKGSSDDGLPVAVIVGVVVGAVLVVGAVVAGVFVMNRKNAQQTANLNTAVSPEADYKEATTGHSL